MKSCSFLLSEKKILIYGAGDKGLRTLNVVRNAGLDAAAFVDKRAKAYVDYHGLKVLAPEDLNSFEFKSDFAVIVTVKNAYAHNEIAASLVEKGFSNIIFMPLYVLKGGKDNPALNAIMQANIMLTDEGKFPDAECPSVISEDFISFPDNSVICQTDDKIKLYLPAEYLFLSDENNGDWLNRNMAVSSSSVLMFEGFNNKQVGERNKGLLEYINDAAETAVKNGVPVNDDWKSNFISGKFSVYENMRKQLMLNPEFFKDNCSEAEYKGSSRFEIIGTGKNRISFLISQKFRYIPIIISNEDYNDFINEALLNKVKKYIGAKKLKYPISHPAFFEYDCEFDDYVFQWLVPIVRRLFSDLIEKGTNISEITCIDMCEDYGNTYRFLSMLGFSICRTDNGELSAILDKLFGIQTIITDKDDANNADIAFADRYGDLEILIQRRIPILFYRGQTLNKGFLDLLTKQGYSYEQIFETYVNGSIICGYYINNDK